MRYLFLIIFPLFLVFSAFSQKDTQALKILEAVEKKAKSYKTVDAKFKYKLKSPNNDEENYEGTVLIKGKKFKMELDGTTTISNGKVRWVYLRESNEVNVSEVLDNESLDFEERFLNNPLSIYSIYKTGFKYIVAGTGEIGDKKLTMVDLAPEDINVSYFKIRCWVTDDNNLNTIKYFLKDGTRMSLTLEDIKTNTKTHDSVFNFDASKHPNVEIIDLR